MFNHIYIYIYIHVYTCVCVCVWLAIYDRLSLSSVWVHAFDNQTSSAGSGASTTVTVTSTSAPRSLSWDPRVWGGSPKKTWARLAMPKCGTPGYSTPSKRDGFRENQWKTIIWVWLKRGCGAHQICNFSGTSRFGIPSSWTTHFG